MATYHETLLEMQDAVQVCVVFDVFCRMMRLSVT